MKLSKGIRATIHSLLILTFMLTDIAGAQEKATTRMVRDWVSANERAIITSYMDFLRLPNVATSLPDIRTNAAFIVEQLEKRGVYAEIIGVEGAPPSVFGRLEVPGAEHTVVIYAHFDGQPADASLWTSPPWEPQLRTIDGQTVDLETVEGRLDPELRLHARSASDDKVAVMAILAALDAMRDLGIKPDINLLFFFEGEEEAGSPHLPEILNKHAALLASDGWIFCDGPVHQSRRPLLYFGARGVVGAQITVYGPNRTLHSGHYGNWAPNPINELIHLLAQLRDRNGRILIPGIYDHVRPLTELEQQALKDAPVIDAALRAELALASSEADNALLNERITLPALNMLGIQGGGVGDAARNAISDTATANIGFRLVPDLSPALVKELTEAWLTELGYHIVHEEPTEAQRGVIENLVYIRWGRGYESARTPMEHPFSRALVRTLRSTAGEDLILMPTAGGSLPMRIFSDILDVPVVVMPIANHDNNQHGPDENIRLQNLWDGIGVYVTVFSSLGENWDE